MGGHWIIEQQELDGTCFDLKDREEQDPALQERLKKYLSEHAEECADCGLTQEDGESLFFHQADWTRVLCTDCHRMEHTAEHGLGGDDWCYTECDAEENPDLWRYSEAWMMVDRIMSKEAEKEEAALYRHNKKLEEEKQRKEVAEK